MNKIVNSRAYKKAGLCLITLSLWVTLSATANAADWTLAPVASLKVEYNDNRRLTTLDHDSVVGRVLDLRAIIKAESDVNETEIKPRLSSERYSGDGQLDSNNQYLDASTSYFSESSRWTLKGNITRDNTLTSELEGTDLVEAQRRREKWNIDPQWIQELTDWTIFSLSLSNSAVTYEDAAALGLVDYDVKEISTMVSHTLTEGTTINATLYSSSMEAPDAGNETDTSGLSIGIDYKNQDTLNFGLQIGTRKSDYKLTLLPATVIEDSEDGYTLDMNVAKDFEYSHWKLSLDRAVLPSGVGRLIQQDKIVLRNSYELSPNLRSNVSITALRNKEIQQNITSQDRDYQNAVIALNWNMMPDWVLNSAYTYKTNKYETSSEEATSNALQFNIIYTGLNN